jgi:hypothetical protein
MKEYEVGDRVEIAERLVDNRSQITIASGAVLTLIDGPFLGERGDIIWEALSPGGILIVVPQELFADEKDTFYLAPGGAW